MSLCAGRFKKLALCECGEQEYKICLIKRVPTVHYNPSIICFLYMHLCTLPLHLHPFVHVHSVASNYPVAVRLVSAVRRWDYLAAMYNHVDRKASV